MDGKPKSGGKYIKSQVSLPKKGDKVEIIVKPYKSKITKVGIIKDVLTKKTTPFSPSQTGSAVYSPP